MPANRLAYHPGAAIVPLLFAATLFLSASLLFLVEPLIGKLLLPLLGGTPAVWNTCMVFFQILLLVGYLYAHRTTSSLPPRKQIVLHLAVIGAGIAALAIGAALSSNGSPLPIVKSLSMQGSKNPFFGVLALLTVAVGLPFFVLSTSAPLLQKWFAQTGHPSAKDPYFLYGASNLGSLLSLIAYPAIVEPNLRLIEQAWVFAGGFVVLAGLIFACSRAVKTDTVISHTENVDAGPAPTGWQKLRWMMLAFVPSSLMLGVTTFVSTDMASIPLLWIIPLALYLVSFIIVFAKVPPGLHMLMTLIMPVLILLVAFLMTSHVQAKFGLQVLMHMATFFIVCMVCHGELAHTRPKAKYLTNFYLLMSFGGMLGGMFNALIAPMVFTFTSEYPISLIIGCALLPVLAVMPKRNPEDGPWLLFWDVMIALSMFAGCRFLQTNQFELAAFVTTHLHEIIAGLVTFGITTAVLTFLLEHTPDDRIGFAVAVGVGGAIFAVTGAMFKSLFVAEDATGWIVKGPLLVGFASAALSIVGLGMYWKSRASSETARKRMRIAGMGLLGAIFAMLVLAEFAYEDARVILAKNAIGQLTVRQILTYGLPAMICYFLVERPGRFALAVGAFWLASFVTETKATKGEKESLYVRTFFGLLKIHDGEFVPIRSFKPDSPREGFDLEGNPVYRRYCRQLAHGTTLHGMQEIDNEANFIAQTLQPLAATDPFAAAAIMASGSMNHWQYPMRDPLTYYHRQGPVGAIFNAFENRNGARPTANTDVACIGLGTGTLSSYGKPGQKMTFFEIDQTVRDLVEPGNYFRYLADAKAQGVLIDFVMGDARISLEQSDKKYGLMLIDAFSSDAIPAHLLTRQAVKMYFDRLEEDGLLAIHVSNRYLDLEPVVEAIAHDGGYVARTMYGTQNDRTGRSAASWIVLARSIEHLGRIDADTKASLEKQAAIRARNEAKGVGETLESLTIRDGWMPLEHRDDLRVWTDDYAPIIKILRGEWKFWGKD